jgi:sterol 3beta-glucosyltransferase
LLFPRVSSVVHHGGAGTTAEGLRAGRPTVVVPGGGDQPFWGRRVERLGVGPAPVPGWRLSVESLAAAIRATLNDARMRERAGLLGERIRSEDGVGETAALIERETASR